MQGHELLERLPEGLQTLLGRVGEIAHERGEPAYLVGGTVRDLILERPNEDIDVVVVGDGMAVAQALSRELDGQLTRHHAFQTATVDLADGGRVDFATARGEDYPTPGQLPRVRAGTLEEDLARRDFTINAVALGLAPAAEPQIVDPFDGRSDMRQGLVRILHEGSFVDDPTRMLRAVRFALRFDYRLEPRTATALADGVRGRNLDPISGDRLRREVQKGLTEAPVRYPTALDEHGLLAALHPGLEADPDRVRRLQREVQAYDEMRASSPTVEPVWPLTLALLARQLSPQARWELVRRMRLSRRQRRPLLETGAPWAAARGRLDALDALALADVVEAVESLSDEALLVALSGLGAEQEDLASLVRRTLREARSAAPWLDGDQLVALGCPPGPRVGELLRALRRARLEGRTADADDERDLARRLIDQTRN